MEQNEEKVIQEKVIQMFSIIEYFEKTLEDMVEQLDNKMREWNASYWPYVPVKLFNLINKTIKIEPQESITDDDLKNEFSGAEKEKHLELTNKIKSFITKFYMLNPTINHLKQEYITNILDIYDIEFRTSFSHGGKYCGKYYKEVVGNIIEEYSKLVAEDLIKLIQDAPEEINIDEQRFTGINKTCVDVINFEDAAKLHEILTDLDNVIFIQPAEYMRPGSTSPVDYKYLALTYPKKYIKDWLNESKKIEYCNTDPDNKLYQKTPYVLSPLNFNCANAYVRLWEILHIIHSPQRIFYVLPSHSEGPKHKCMKEGESEEIIKIGICKGDNCWKWDSKKKCIKASNEEKLKIQTECNTREFEDYIKRSEKLKEKKRLKNKRRSSEPEPLKTTQIIKKYKSDG